MSKILTKLITRMISNKFSHDSSETHLFSQQNHGSIEKGVSGVKFWKSNSKSMIFTIGLIIGFYYLSIYKVKQDDFSDVDSKGNLRTKL